MSAFPASPISPSQFFEEWLPQAFADADLPPEARDVDAEIGILLEGDGGGEWVFAVKGGAMAVRQASRADTAFSLVQTVEDWRGALWEGRGGAIGRQAASMFDPAARAAGDAPRPGELGGPPSPAALEQMRKLDGVIRMVVTGGEGGDWSVSFKLGPGAIPAEPTTSLAFTSEDAEALGRGELDPMQAFMSGRIQITGDMTLMMQMQAIQMQAAAQAAAAKAAAGGNGSGSA